MTDVNKLVESVANGVDPRQVLSEAVIGVPYDGGRLKTYFDCNGDLRFCTEDDVLIDPYSDQQMSEVARISNTLSVDNPLFDIFESFEGTLDELIAAIKSLYIMTG